MPTRQTRLLILLAIVGSIAGLLLVRERLALVSLSVLILLVLEWTLFRLRVEFSLRRFSCRRTVNGSSSADGSPTSASRRRNNAARQRAQPVELKPHESLLRTPDHQRLCSSALLLITATAEVYLEAVILRAQVVEFQASSSGLSDCSACSSRIASFRRDRRFEFFPRARRLNRDIR